MTVKRIVIIALSAISMLSCSNRVMFSSFQPVPLDGWNMDSVVTFSVPITDTVTPYDILLHIRHTDAYAYQNMWLFVETQHATRATRDTIEIYLADDRGHWLGNGRTTVDMPVLLKENFVFTDSLYTLSICQGMRDLSLTGISDIGVEIVKATDNHE